MSANAFFDTNILIYALSAEDPRASIAEQLLASGGAISVQVLNEFAAVARKKLNMSWPEITRALKAIRTLCDRPVPLTLDIHTEALRLANCLGYGIYDCLILAAALSTNCDTLYSEDLQHGRKIDTLTIINPFRESATP